MDQGNWKTTSTFPRAQSRALIGLANGLTSKEIARDAGVSPNTINNTLGQIREKWGKNYERKGKRAWLVSEAIRRGILIPCTPVFMILFMTCIVMASNLFSIELRRTSNRLAARTIASRMVKGKRTQEALTVDFEFNSMTPDSLMAFFEATPAKTNTIAPWSSAAWMQRDLNNDDREQLWRSQFELISQAA